MTSSSQDEMSNQLRITSLERELAEMQNLMKDEHTELRLRLDSLEKDEVSAKLIKLEALCASLQAESAKADEGKGELPKADEGLNEKARTLSFSEVHQMANEDAALEESVWDATVFIGFECVGAVDSISIGIGAVLNCLIQVAFCLVIYVNFSSNTIGDDTITAVKRWRATVGHDIKYADMLSQVSLVSQVCGGNTGLPVAGSQLQMSDDLRQYLTPEIEDHFLRKLDGKVLCNLSLLLFYWLVFHDLRNNLKLFGAVLTHRTGSGQVEVDGDGNLSISTISPFQKTVVLVLMFLPRLVVEIFLLISGATFLCYTDNIGDLVLNAVALAFILDIDEMSYLMFVPERVKHLLENVGSIAVEIPASPRFQKINAILVLFASCLGLLVVNIVYLVPFQDDIADAFKWLCQGDKNFVYTVDKAAGIVYWHSTNEYELQPVKTYAERALVALTEVESSGKEGSRAIEISNWNTMKALYKEGVATSAQLLRCEDHLTSETAVAEAYSSDGARYYAMLELMREATSNSSLVSCQDVPRHLCFRLREVRAACPQTCGCGSPWCGLIFATAEHGCPGSCGVEYNSYFKGGMLNTIKGWKGQEPAQVHLLETCRDTPVEILRNLASWKNYVDSFRVLAETYVGPAEADKLATMLATDGCRAAPELGEKHMLHICSIGDKGRSARPWCPCSCGCRWVGTADRDECPLSCNDRGPHFPEKAEDIDCAIEWKGGDFFFDMSANFKMSDMNGDWLVSQEEARTIMEKELQGADKLHMDAMLKAQVACDQNEDGFIDAREAEIMETQARCENCNCLDGKKKVMNLR